MRLKSHPKFEEKLICGLENDRNFPNFHQNTCKCQNWGFWRGPIVQCRKCTSQKFTEELCAMTMENDTKFEEELQFKIDMRDLINFDSRTRKISKTCTLMVCFWSKYKMFELKKYRGVMFDGTKDWCKIWRKTDLCLQKMTWRIWQIFFPRQQNSNFL